MKISIFSGTSKFFLSTLLIFSLSSLAISPAPAVTNLGDQIVRSNLTLSAAQSPYLVTGIIQIPEGITLKIEPGVAITFQPGSGIKNFGNVIVGDLQSQAIVTIQNNRMEEINTGNESLISGVSKSSIQISNTELISKNQDSLVFGCQSLSISNSTITGFNRIVKQQECLRFSIENSYIKNLKYLYTCAFDGHPDLFVLRNNIFDGAISFCEVPNRTLDTYGFNNVQGAKTVFDVSGNDFSSIPEINLPVGFDDYKFSSNNFRSVGRIKLFSYTKPGKPVTTDLSGNYWGMPYSESSLRSSIKVTDANTDMTLKDSIILTPIIANPFPSDSKAMTLKQQQADKAAASKKTTITCIKGKTVKKVSAVKPKCPAGYKKK